MKSKVQYKKKGNNRNLLRYEAVITTRFVTHNLPRVQSLTSLITQIQWKCSVQVKVYGQRPPFLRWIFANKFAAFILGLKTKISIIRTISEAQSAYGMHERMCHIVISVSVYALNHFIIVVNRLYYDVVRLICFGIFRNHDGIQWYKP